MAKTVGDFIWERLHQWGVRCVFGYPGDGINGLLGGLQRLGTGGSHPRTSTPYKRSGFVDRRNHYVI